MCARTRDCRRWVRTLYSDRPPASAIATQEIYRLGKQADYTERTIKRAYQAETTAIEQRRPNGALDCWLRVLNESA